jgi:hypothetical protein
LKVAAVETLLEEFASGKDRILDYQALGRFEREAAPLFSLLEEAEVTLMEQAVQDFLERWKSDARLKTRFAEPALGLEVIFRYLNGETTGGNGRAPRPAIRAAFRLSTLVPEDRQHLIKVALERLQPESE